MDAQFRVQVFVEFYVYTPKPPYIHMSIRRVLPILSCLYAESSLYSHVYTLSPPYIDMSIRRVLPIFTCLYADTSLYSHVLAWFLSAYIALLLLYPLPILPDVYVCCHGNVSLQSCRTSDMERFPQLV